MEKEVIDNHKRYLERKTLYKSFGYDVDKERDFIIEQAQPISGKIIEAGTGKGHFTLALAKQGYEFTAFDISETEQNFAKLNLRYFDLDKQVVFLIENGESLSLKDKSFDAIFSVNTLHHLANPYKVVDEFIRILSLEGKLILSDFTKEGLVVMDKIHATEGRKHELCEVTLANVDKYLINRGFRTEEHISSFQEVLIAYRKIIKK